MPSSDSSARPDLLLEYAHSTRQRCLGLRGGAVGQLTDELTRARQRCASLGSLGLIEHEVDDFLGDVYRLSAMVEEVAQAFLEADGMVALLAPGGGYTVRPAAAVLRRPGTIAGLTATDIGALGLWVLDTGLWGWERRQWVINLLGVRGPLEAILDRVVTPTLLPRVFGPGGGRLSRAINLANIVLDANTIQDQGNPFRAYRERGSNYVADHQQLWLDVALVAFLREPSPPTAVAVAVFTTSWAVWKTQDERRRATNRFIATADRTQDRVRNQARERIHRATDQIRGWAGDDPYGGPVDPKLPTSPVEPMLDAVDDAADTTDRVADAIVSDVRHTVERTQDAVDAAVDGGLEIGEKLVDGGVGTIKQAWPFD